MRKKVCLIIPPSPFLLDERVFPSLGILKVAANLERQGVQVDMLDLSGVANYLEVVHLYASSHRDVRHFGITATTPQFPNAVEIAMSLNVLSDVPRTLTIGGPHATLVCAAVKGERKAGVEGRAHKALQRLQIFETVVAGDGDLLTFDQMFGGGVVDADDPKGDLFMTDEVYELTSPPARHLIDLSSYHYQIEGRPATSLIAQLGCPFQCGFCGGRLSPMLRRIRVRSTQNILTEVESLHREYGHTGFMFYDDEMNVSKSMVELMDGLTDLQMRLGTEFRLRGFVKAELFTREQAEAMHRAGFRWLLTGFESGSPRILENINKRATREENTRAVETARAAGLKVKALMSIGHPGENPETIQDTQDWLLQVRPDDFDITIITTYPGSPYYDQAVETSPGIWTYTAKSGDRLHATELDYSVTADYYKGQPDGGYRAYVRTDYMSEAGLVASRDWLERHVRQELGIPFNPSTVAVNYEHSMGQSLPGTLLRSSGEVRKVVHLPVIR